MFINGQAPSSATAVLTVGANKTMYVKTIIFHNTTSENQTVFVYLVKNNTGSVGVADVTNIIQEEVLEAKGTSEFSPSYPFELNEENDAVFISCSNISAVNYFINGYEEDLS